MRYRYEAKNTNGGFRQGYIIAQDQAHAEALLTENGLVILTLAEQAEPLLDRLNIFGIGKSVPIKEMVLFARQLSTLIGAQVPLLQSLRILLVQITNEYLKKITQEVIDSIEGGDSLSLSLSRYPEVFGNVFVNVVHAGELSGTLDKSLLYLADQMEKDYELNHKVRSAMTYPIFVLAAVVLVGGFMFIFILPNLESVIIDQGGNIPLTTQLLISFTNFLTRYWWAIIVAFCALVAGFKYALKTVPGRYAWDRFKVSAPILGNIFQKIYLARFSRNLSTLIMGGIPIIKALQIVGELVSNVVYKDIILDAADKLTAGKQISEALMGHKEIPPIVTQMVQVGEQSATLTSILAKLATFYEKEVDSVIGSLTTLLEPIIILVLGVAVGVLCAGILLPIYTLGTSAGS
jgi:type IV pilus assembly protein PilC